MSDADRLVARYALDEWHRETVERTDCPSVHVLGIFEFQFGEVGELPDIIETLAKDYADG